MLDKKLRINVRGVLKSSWHSLKNVPYIGGIIHLGPCIWQIMLQSGHVPHRWIVVNRFMLNNKVANYITFSINFVFRLEFSDLILRKINFRLGCDPLKLNFRLVCNPIEIKFHIRLWHHWNSILDWAVTQMKLNPRWVYDPIES